MERKEISKAVLKRLPGYLSYLKSLPEGTATYISATALVNALGMGEVLVRKGQHITSGTVIGRLKGEDSDASQSLELAFELWRDGTAVDPERYILF